MPWQPTPRLRLTSPFPNTSLVSPSPTFLFFSGTVPPIQPSSLSLSTLEKDQNHIPSLSDARTLARPPTLSSPAPKLCFTFVRSRPTLSSNTKEKKASRVSVCCSHHSVIITGKRRSACCDQSTIGAGVRGISSTFNFQRPWGCGYGDGGADQRRRTRRQGTLQLHGALSGRALRSDKADRQREPLGH